LLDVAQAESNSVVNVTTICCGPVTVSKRPSAVSLRGWNCNDCRVGMAAHEEFCGGINISGLAVALKFASV